MSRCEDCIHGDICERFAGLRTLVCGYKADERCKMFKPTADVVPKSEYDNLKSQFEALDHECDRLERAESNRHDAIEQAKIEIAMEIFEEIEKLIFSKCFSVRADRDVTGLIIDGEMLSELKKKYTNN